MTKKRNLVTKRGVKPQGPYSQGIIASGSMLYVAAQGPFDPATGELVGMTFKAQAEQVFRNVQAIIEAAGASMADVVKMTVFITDWAHFSELNEVYVRYFPEPYPARTPIRVELLPSVLCSADAIVALSS